MACKSRVLVFEWLVFLMVVLPYLVGAGEEKYDLGYHFEPGSVERFKIEFSQEYEVKGYSFFTLIDMEITEKCTKALGDTAFNMEITFDKVSASFKRNDELYDTDIEDQMAGQAFSFNMDKHGNVSDLEPIGYVEDWESVSSLLYFIIMGSYPYVPDSLVDLGGRWTHEGSGLRDRKFQMSSESKSEFTFKEVKKKEGRKCAKIEGGGETYIHGRIKNDMGRFVLDGDGKDKLECYFDFENGRTIKVKRKSELQTTLIGSGGSAAEKREVYRTDIVINFEKEPK